jgi:predicted DNA-binding transcriptional regulator AlpA
MTQNTAARAALPETGYIRQAQLIGEAPITLEQAEANKLAGRGPRRPRGGSAAIIPWSSATLWRKVKARQFPAPVKLSEGVTAWRVESVLAWIDGRAAAA